MQQNEIPSYWIKLYMAGDLSQAKQVCREFCFAKGWCVTVSPTTYIYTGGEEEGFMIGMVNYPRFPTDHLVLWNKAKELAKLLRTRLCQHSYLLQDPYKTLWDTLRDNP